jgi:hypothetical protein
VSARAEPPFDRAPRPSATTSIAQVIIVQDDRATDAFDAQPEVVQRLVQLGITNFIGQIDPAAAWRRLVGTQDVVGIKVYSLPGPAVGTRPAVVAAVVEGLLAAKIPKSNIVIWDRQLSDLRRAGFGQVAQQYGVRLAGALDSGWDEATFYDSALLGQLIYGDLEFQKKGDGIGRKSFATKLLTKEITKIINISPMLNHNSVGVCGNLYSLAFGSVDNTIRFEGDAAKLAEAVPDIYNLPGLGDHVVLNIVDALICQYEGEQIGRLHNSIALNELRFSKDPVALDVLSTQEILKQRGRAEGLSSTHTNRFDLYHNAALLELGIADPKKIDLHIVKAAE